MIDPQLANYIVEARIAEMSNEEIRQELSKNGWSAAAIDEALGKPIAVSSTATSYLTDSKQSMTALNPKPLKTDVVSSTLSPSISDANMLIAFPAATAAPPPQKRKPLFIALIILGVLALAGGGAYYYFFVRVVSVPTL